MYSTSDKAAAPTGPLPGQEVNRGLRERLMSIRTRLDACIAESIAIRAGFTGEGTPATGAAGPSVPGPYEVQKELSIVEEQVNSLEKHLSEIRASI